MSSLPTYGPLVLANPAFAPFLQMCPAIERHTRVAFRHWSESDREEAVAEAIAAAYASYLRLKAQGKNPIRDFPSRMATFAALHVKDNRHVGGQQSSSDVLSRKTQRRHGFGVETLPSLKTSLTKLYGASNGQRNQDAFEECLHEKRTTSIPDLVAFRVDFREFLKTLSQRDQKMAKDLGLGNSAKAVARKYQLSSGRVTQLRQEWERDWQAFQGDLAASA